MKLKLVIIFSLLISYSCGNKNAYHKVQKIQNEKKLIKTALSNNPVKSISAMDKIINLGLIIKMSERSPDGIKFYEAPEIIAYNADLLVNILLKAENICVRRMAISTADNPIFTDVLLKTASQDKDTTCSIFAFSKLLWFKKPELSDTLIAIACNSKITSLRSEIFDFYFPLNSEIDPDSILDSINKFSQKIGHNEIQGKIEDRIAGLKFLSSFNKLSNENEINSFLINCNDYKLLSFLYSYWDEKCNGCKDLSRFNNIIFLKLITLDPYLAKYLGRLKLHYKYFVAARKKYGNNIGHEFFFEKKTITEYDAVVGIYNDNGNSIFSKKYESAKAGEFVDIQGPTHEDYIEIIYNDDFSEVCNSLFGLIGKNELTDIALHTENYFLFHEILKLIKDDAELLKKILINRQALFTHRIYKVNANYPYLLNACSLDQIKEIAIKGNIEPIRKSALDKLATTQKEEALILIIKNAKDSEIRNKAMYYLSSSDPEVWKDLFIYVVNNDSDCRLKWQAIGHLRHHSVPF